MIKTARHAYSGEFCTAMLNAVRFYINSKTKSPFIIAKFAVYSCINHKYGNDSHGSEVMLKKWLPNQLLDIFEKKVQIKDLKRALVGTTKQGVPKFKDSPEFSTPLKFILLAIAKYKDCYLSMNKIAKITSLSRDAVIQNLKILNQNKITSTVKRHTKSGDSDSNLYHIDMDIFNSFFADGVVIQDDPINKVRFNNLTKQESTREKNIRTHSLPNNFLPTEEHNQICIKKGLDINNVLEIFTKYQKLEQTKSKNWETTFTLWLIRERGGKKNNNGNREIKSTVPSFERNTSKQKREPLGEEGTKHKNKAMEVKKYKKTNELSLEGSD